MTRFKENIKEIVKGDIFYAAGSFRIAAFGAIIDSFEDGEFWVVYDTLGGFWTEEEVRSASEAFEKK